MMIKSITFIILLLLPYAVFAAGGETKLQISLLSSGSADGICKSVVETQGYRCEEHKVTTKDGYILSMQRIPAGRSGTTTTGARPPVLLQHGLFTDTRSWLANSPDQSLGFILADNGFDVWMANTRGTEFSRGHTSLSISDPEYWNWTWDELAAYDLPATVEYVFNQTGQKVHYVGDSLGTLIAVAAFSRNRALNMTRSASLLCPSVYYGQMPSPLVKAVANAFIADKLYLLGVVEFSPRGVPGEIVLDIACSIIDCANSVLTDIISGPNCCLNSSNSYLTLLQQPTATKNLVHLSQSIRRGTVAMYDYGNIVDNNKNYRQPTPPPYNLKNIPNNLPLLLAYGGKDFLSGVQDVKILIADLSDHDPNKLVLLYRDDYAHFDFVLAVNANQVVFNPLIAFLKMN